MTASANSVAWATTLLSQARPEQVFFPGTAAYELARNGFWSNIQKELQPACIYQPRNAADVSLAVVIFNITKCPFNVKSGGHGRFAGESSIGNEGVLIDLAHINHIKVSDDRKSVAVGPGLRWVDVYGCLEPLHLTVVGGRDADVGVGGFLLAGGIAFHSSMYGWATENIRSMEVVLASGLVVTASESSHPHLFRALRGGGGNFGIVVSFVLDAYPYAGMWGGRRFTSDEDTGALLDAFMKYGHQSPADPKVSVILNHTILNGEFVWVNDLEYCEPVVLAPDGPLIPDLLQDFMKLPTSMDETTNTHNSALTVAMASGSPRGYRNSYWGLAAKLDRRVLDFYVEMYRREGAKLAQLPGVGAGGDIQVITAGMRAAMGRRGGNVLGLSDSTEPLLLFNPAPRWTDPRHDEIVLSTINTIITATEARARELGLAHSFLYMNYTAGWQDPIAGYGAEQKRFLQSVSRKYDPEGFFQTIRKGGFKLGGSPKSLQQLGRLKL
ncbi:FAD binding domain-containing protein [Cladophialophora immunda]|nr:FAD binding domain-containing protein [Cladophialophora immunda]